MHHRLGLSEFSTRVIRIAPTFHGDAFEATICCGNSVERAFGQERLRVGIHCVDLSRMMLAASLPLLDSFRQDSIAHAVGRMVDIRIGDGPIKGRFKFNDTENGKRAAALVKDGKVDLAMAYATLEMEIFDKDNRRIDPHDGSRSSEPGITFEVARWTPAALALVKSNDDGEFQDRAFHSPVTPAVVEIFERMTARQMMTIDNHRQQSGPRMRPVIGVSIFNGRDDDDHGGPYRKIVLPDRNQVLYGKPEPLR